MTLRRKVEVFFRNVQILVAFLIIGFSVFCFILSCTTNGWQREVTSTRVVDQGLWTYCIEDKAADIEYACHTTQGTACNYRHEGHSLKCEEMDDVLESMGRARTSCIDCLKTNGARLFSVLCIIGSSVSAFSCILFLLGYESFLLLVPWVGVFTFGSGVTSMGFYINLYLNGSNRSREEGKAQLDYSFGIHVIATACVLLGSLVYYHAARRTNRARKRERTEMKYLDDR